MLKWEALSVPAIDIPEEFYSSTMNDVGFAPETGGSMSAMDPWPGRGVSQGKSPSFPTFRSHHSRETFGPRRGHFIKMSRPRPIMPLPHLTLPSRRLSTSPPSPPAHRRPPTSSHFLSQHRTIDTALSAIPSSPTNTRLSHVDNDPTPPTCLAKRSTVPIRSLCPPTSTTVSCP